MLDVVVFVAETEDAVLLWVAGDVATGVVVGVAVVNFCTMLMSAF